MLLPAWSSPKIPNIRNRHSLGECESLRPLPRHLSELVPMKHKKLRNVPDAEHNQEPRLTIQAITMKMNRLNGLGVASPTLAKWEIAGYVF